MKMLSALVSGSEDRIIRILHGYTLGRGYAKYVSTLEEAWRMSVRALSANMVMACKNFDGPPELGPDEDYLNDPIAQFGILEAQRHRERGISIDMFLGLLKYYRQSYLDLVIDAGFDRECEEKCRRFVDRFYDRIEIGLCKEWVDTDQAKLLAELQASNRHVTNEKNKYLTIFESSSQPVILLNDDLTVENLNLAAVEMLQGASIPGASYYCSQRDRILENADDDEAGASLGAKPVEKLLPELARNLGIFAGGTMNAHVVEKRLELGGVQRDFEVRMSRMLDISRKFSGLLVTLTDITERKRAEAMLASVNRQNELLLNSVGDGIYGLDLEGRTTFVNPKAVNLVGYNLEEMIDRPQHDLIHHTKSDGSPYRREECPIYATFKDGQVHHVETEVFWRKDGTSFPVAYTSTPIHDENGELQGAVAVFSDITERKRLEEGQSRLAAIVESSDVAIIGKTLEGVVTSWNRGAEEIYGYTAEEVVGRSISFLTPNDRPDEVPAMLQRISRGEDVKQHETLRRKKDGRSINVSLSISAIKDTLGKIVGASTIARDVTERKQMEIEREKFVSELQEALARIKVLSGLLPICANCKKIRDDQGYWRQIEVYIRDHSDAEFSHGICPGCAKKLYPEVFDKKPELFNEMYPEVSDK